MHDAVADARQRHLMLCIFALGAIVMFFLNALVDNAGVFHDEYLYKADADLDLDQDETCRKGLNDYIPNRLFVLVYGLASRAGQNYYLAAQFFNVVFWALGLLAVCELARELGLRGRQPAVLAGLAADSRALLQPLQPVSMARLDERPHAGPLFYERRFGFSWEQMQARLAGQYGVQGLCADPAHRPGFRHRLC